MIVKPHIQVLDHCRREHLLRRARGFGRSDVTKNQVTARQEAGIRAEHGVH